MPGLDAELEAALKAMETSFHVRLISTFEPDLVWALADEEATALLEKWPDFDQFPVEDGGVTVGILLREDKSRGKTVRQSMHPLRDGLIVSADMPITSLIPQLSKNHFRLVLRGGRIDGLVTQSDLIKLPVRMLLFGLINHLEICLRALVRKRLSVPEWMNLLKLRQRQAVEREVARLRNDRFEPDALECTNLSDVVEVLASQPDLDPDFRAQLDEIRMLRNGVVHARTYISSAAEVEELVKRFKNIESWIRRISAVLAVP